jgi:hypothetical protein
MKLQEAVSVTHYLLNTPKFWLMGNPMLWDVALEAGQGILVGCLPPSGIPFR